MRWALLLVELRHGGHHRVHGVHDQRHHRVGAVLGAGLHHLLHAGGVGAGFGGGPIFGRRNGWVGTRSLGGNEAFGSSLSKETI